MRANQSERLAAETEEQREAWLQRLRANQSERLAAETEEQRSRPGFRGCVPIRKWGDWLLRLKNRERPGCSVTERDTGSKNSHSSYCLKFSNNAHAQFNNWQAQARPKLV